VIIINKKGRKQKYPESFAENILTRYAENHQYIKKLHYKTIFEYTLNLKSEKILSEIPEISYWRKENRTGGKLIKQFNENILNSNEEIDSELETINFLKLFKNNLDKPKDFILLEKFLNKKNKEINNLKHGKDSLEVELKSLRNQIHKYNEQNEHLEELLINVYHYLIKEHQTKAIPLFEDSFNQIFSDPLNYTQLNDNETTTNKKSNVIRKLFESKLEE